MKNLRDVFWVCLMAPVYTWADGSSVGKIYDPYVEQLGTEIELEYLGREGTEKTDLYRLGIGAPLSESVFAEISVIAESPENGGTDIEGYEAELKWQLTEQGEYFADFGAMLEVEREPEADLWEGAALLLVSRDFGRTTATANMAVAYEDSRDLGGEWETSLAIKWRYRYRQGLEPSLEYFKGEETNAIGPVLNGLWKVGIRKSLQWELGILFEVDDDNPVDKIIKARIEYEF